MLFRRPAQLTLALLLFAATTSAKEIYVDNLQGRDGNDGALSFVNHGTTGPVRTLARAGELARTGDVIVLNNTGVPYYDSISLMGERHSGEPSLPFVIEGNGATISGLRSIPPQGWRQVDKKLWKVTFTRKGFYRLLRNGQPLPEFRPEAASNPLALLPAGHWVAWHGSVYFRQDGIDTPEYQAFAYSADQTGISLHSVRNVLISNVTLQHFRFDGLHAQGLCEQVQLNNVTAVENGRAGIVSSGASQIEIFGGLAARNGRHQILTNDRSTASQVATEPAPETK